MMDKTDYDSDNMEARFVAMREQVQAVRQQVRYEALPSDVNRRRERREVLSAYMEIASWNLYHPGEPLPHWSATTTKRYWEMYVSGELPLVQ